MKTKMETKKLLVSFLALVLVLSLVSTVSAVDPVATRLLVEVNGVPVNGNGAAGNPAIVAGDTIIVRVEFDSLVNASDITVEVELDTGKEDVKAETRPFDVEAGQRYVKALQLEVPFDLKDELSGFATLNVEVSGSSFKTEKPFQLRVQRESFNANIKAISVPQTVTAGETFPVDVVLKNIGYNDLDDVFVTARISALDIERTAFFGDLVALECDDDLDSVENFGVDITRKCNEDDEDTVTGRLFLQMPFSVQSGTYTLEVMVENDDTTSSEVVQVVVKNAFSAGNFVVSGNQLLIVNPTNQVVVYRLIPEATPTVSVRLSENLVAVPAGSSKTVTVDASGVTGQTFSVNVFDVSGNLVDTVQFSTAVDGRDVTSPIVVLTVILAIIFIVLLVVLLVLIGRKPEKSEEFGESYY